MRKVESFREIVHNTSRLPPTQLMVELPVLGTATYLHLQNSIRNCGLLAADYSQSKQVIYKMRFPDTSLRVTYIQLWLLEAYTCGDNRLALPSMFQYFWYS